MPTLVAAGIAAATGLAATSTAVVIASNVLVAGVSIGASYALQGALAPKPSSAAATFAQAVNSPEIRGSIRQATPAQRVAYGRVRTGGAVFFLEVVPPYLYLGLLHSSRQVDGIEAAWIGESPVVFGGDRSILTAPFRNGPTTRVWMSFRDGAADQAIDPLLAADFTSLASTFRQRGIATTLWKFDYGSDYDEFLSLYGNVQIPNVQVLLRGARVYDPRAAAQDRDDAATWTWTDNASLIQTDFLRAAYGGRIDAAAIDWDLVAAAADHDDALVPLLAGGWQRRYTADGLVTLDQSPFEILGSLLTANRGLVVSNGGSVGVLSSRPRVASFVVHDGNLAAGFTYRDDRPRRDVLNAIRCRFVAPERDYQTADGPVLVRADLQTADGEPLDATLDLPFTRGHARAQRIMKAALDDSRIGRQLTCSVRLDRLSIRIQAGDVVTVDSTTFPELAGTYEVRERGFTEDFAAVGLTLAEYDAGIETDWVPADDEQDFSLASLDLS